MVPPRPPIPPREPARSRAAPAARFGSLQLTLWSLWTVAVLGRAYLYVRPALDTGAPVDLLGLVLHSVLVGLVGLVAITLIELRLEPWRFPDDEPPPPDDDPRAPD